jgi:hypothetical protein
MTAFNQKSTVGTYAENTELYVAGTYLELEATEFDEATAGYTPAIGDVLCYKTDDSNKHAIYDETDKAALVVLGIIDSIVTDAGTNVILGYAKNATCHFGALGMTAVNTAAKKLVLVNALRAKNINVVDAVV